tara:strand:- start:1211 stop:1795 length:585 start_codon:yes stop_codon:yes gene_type:complete
MSKPKFIATFLYTFFFGYLELKWRRLARSLSLVWFIISVVPFCILVIEITDTDNYALLGLFPSLIIILLISWVVEPFVVYKSPKIQQDNNISLSKKNGDIVMKKINLNNSIVYKAVILLVVSFVAMALAVRQGTIPMSSVSIPLFIGFALGPICLSFPYWLFKGRKNFWKKFYDISLYFWAFYSVLMLIMIIFE